MCIRDRYELIRELLSPNLNTMFVTPKDIDESVKRLSFTISEGLNIALILSLIHILKNGQYSYYLDHCYLSIGQEILPCNQILFYQTSDDDSIGQTLIVTGTVELWKSASNDGNFDAKAFYESKKIDFQLKEAIVKNVYGAEDGFGEKIYRLRRKISGVYESCMSTSDAVSYTHLDVYKRQIC